MTSTVATACLPVERPNLLVAGLPLNVVVTIESAEGIIYQRPLCLQMVDI